MSTGQAILLCVLSLLAGGGIGYLIRHLVGRRVLDSADNRARQITADARREAEKLRQEAQVKAKAELLAQRDPLRAE